MGLPADIPSRISACLASGDRALAATLASQVSAAIAKGEASGFDDDLAALRKLAGPNSLGKRAPAGQGEGALNRRLPLDYLARLQTVEAMAKAASSPQERGLAKQAVERLASDLRVDVAIRVALSQPQKMGVCPW